MVALVLSGATVASLFSPATAMAVTGNPLSNATIDSSWTMYLVPNAHIDTAWQWPFEETARDIISDTFSRAVNALKAIRSTNLQCLLPNITNGQKSIIPRCTRISKH